MYIHVYVWVGMVENEEDDTSLSDSELEELSQRYLDEILGAVSPSRPSSQNDIQIESSSSPTTQNGVEPGIYAQYEM